MYNEQKKTCRAGRSRKKRRQLVLPPALASGRLLVQLDAASVGMFRFLLEACDHLAGFTVLDRRVALLKVFFSPHQAAAVQRSLADIHELVPLRIMPNPVTSHEVLLPKHHC